LASAASTAESASAPFVRGERVFDERAQGDLVAGSVRSSPLFRIAATPGPAAAARSTPASSAIPTAFRRAVDQRRRRRARVAPLLDRGERAHADDQGVGGDAAGLAQGHARGLDRVRPLAALIVEAREHARRVGTDVVDAHGLAQLGDRAVVVAELACGHPRQVTRARVVGPVADALLERIQGGPGVTALELDPATDQLRVGRLLQLLRHLLGAIELVEIDQQVGMDEAQPIARVADEIDHLLASERLLRFTHPSVVVREQVRLPPTEARRRPAAPARRPPCRRWSPAGGDSPAGRFGAPLPPRISLRRARAFRSRRRTTSPRW
jgi:hypothetical protein